MPGGAVDRGLRRHSWKAALAGVVLVAGTTTATAQVTVGPPELTGRWSLPFEEGGLDTPVCSIADDGHFACKPVAQASSMLPDGRVFYFDGFEGQENSGPGSMNAGQAMRDSSSRLLDLRGDTPSWTAPAVPTGGASNPNVAPDRSGTPGAMDVTGVAGVPGRPGDGLVGSAWGQAGGPSQAPTAPPDDAAANDGDMFCSDVAQLPDGRLLIAGGTDWYDEPGVDSPANGPVAAHAGLAEAEGLRSSRIFNPGPDTFTATDPMNFNRWYPALVTLPDGRVLVAGGATKRVKNTQASGVRRTEILDPATGRWSEGSNPSASETSLPLSPRLFVMPNGKILYTGAGQAWAPFGAAADEALYGLLQLYDPATGQWEIWGPHTLGARDGAASVLLPLDPPYVRATVLTFGGTLGPPPGGEVGVPLSTLTEMDAKGEITEKPTRFNMLEGRWSPSAVGLPDGTVLAVGGASTSDTMAPGTGLAVRAAELYDPRTQAWYEMARTNRDRTYHHSAVLLPDGRVLFGGHAPPGTVLGQGDLGGPFPNNDRDPSFEIFSPHYLFRGPRPTLGHVQSGIRWGETFPISTRQALSIESVVLIRLPSPEHGIDSDARTVNLAFTRHSNSVHAVAPPNGAIAPPGYYYLFINRQTPRGPVPSMARVVRIGDTSDPAEALQPFPEDTREREGSAHDDANSSPLAPVEKELPEIVGLSDSTPPSPASIPNASPPRPVAGETEGPAGPALPVQAVAARRAAAERLGGKAGPPLALLAGGLSFLGFLVRRRRRGPFTHVAGAPPRRPCP